MRGGARPGAGRKSKAQKFATEIAAAERQITDRLPDIVAAQIDLALGMTVQEVDPKTGGLKVYTRPPDAKAGQYLIDRIAGKPTQRIEAEIETEGEVEVTSAALDAAARELAEWRKQRISELSNWPNLPPTPPTSVTPME